MVLNNEPIIFDTIDNNIIFNRNISNKELLKVKKVCLINGNGLIDECNTSCKEKIILARSLLSDNKTIIINNCLNNIDPISERKIIKNIMTEYNKNIIFISNMKNNIDLFKEYARIKGGKCEKVKYL